MRSFRDSSSSIAAQRWRRQQAGGVPLRRDAAPNTAHDGPKIQAILIFA
jgi:hypothetical protein